MKTGEGGLKFILQGGNESTVPRSTLLFAKSSLRPTSPTKVSSGDASYYDKATSTKINQLPYAKLLALTTSAAKFLLAS